MTNNDKGCWNCRFGGGVKVALQLGRHYVNICENAQVDINGEENEHYLHILAAAHVCAGWQRGPFPPPFAPSS